MTITRDQELWAVALWVEKHHGSNGPNHIAEQVTRLAEEGDFDSVAMWRSSMMRYAIKSGGRASYVLTSANLASYTGAGFRHLSY